VILTSSHEKVRSLLALVFSALTKIESVFSNLDFDRVEDLRKIKRYRDELQEADSKLVSLREQMRLFTFSKNVSIDEMFKEKISIADTFNQIEGMVAKRVEHIIKVVEGMEAKAKTDEQQEYESYAESLADDHGIDLAKEKALDHGY
jgi:hypothetical protein